MRKEIIHWMFYPKNVVIPENLKRTIEVFDANIEEIDSTKNDNNSLRLRSDAVLKIISSGLEELGYDVEKGKKKSDKIRRVVLFGQGGKEELSFEADAYHSEFKVVIEVEAGRAFANYQFLKDIFEASMMQDTDYLIIAVRKLYKGNNDFKKINSHIEAMYLTNKIKLDLKGIVLIGY